MNICARFDQSLENCNFVKNKLRVLYLFNYFIQKTYVNDNKKKELVIYIVFKNVSLYNDQMIFKQKYKIGFYNTTRIFFILFIIYRVYVIITTL